MRLGSDAMTNSSPSRPIQTPLTCGLPSTLIVISWAIALESSRVRWHTGSMTGRTGTGSRTPGWLADYVAHPKHGPLPVLLLILTVATGMVDAVSILSLGRVFVANMTGNIVFIGFALAGAPGFSLQASLVALAAFLIGAAVGGAAVNRYGDRRGVL